MSRRLRSRLRRFSSGRTMPRLIYSSDRRASSGYSHTRPDSLRARVACCRLPDAFDTRIPRPDSHHRVQAISGLLTSQLHQSKLLRRFVVRMFEARTGVIASRKAK